jgi:hypothetical protein
MTTHNVGEERDNRHKDGCASPEQREHDRIYPAYSPCQPIEIDSNDKADF